MDRPNAEQRYRFPLRACRRPVPVTQPGLFRGLFCPAYEQVNLPLQSRILPLSNFLLRGGVNYQLSLAVVFVDDGTTVEQQQVAQLFGVKILSTRLHRH